MTKTVPLVDPRLYATPAHQLAENGVYLEIETQRHIRLVMLPVSGPYIFVEPTNPEDRPDGYRAVDHGYHYVGPLPV